SRARRARRCPGDGSRQSGGRAAPRTQRVKTPGFTWAPLCALGLSLASSATAQTPKQLFEQGVVALDSGAHDDAIAHFELLADRGFVHPDASFNRAAAYVQRAATQAARPGDLGRAAAALSETLLLRPSDEAAEVALERVRSEIARRRAREGASALMLQKRFSRAVVELLPENVWAYSAAAGAFFLTLGLIVLRLAQKPALRLSALTTACFSALVLCTSGAMTAAAGHYRHALTPAVVVAPEARLLDAKGSPVNAAQGPSSVVALPEGARVDILEQRGTLVLVSWGTVEGFVTQGQLRVLQRPP
ncbi:MAG TPA: hypothetical protein VK524_29220, partial [Polyangiaceae bacterium]|nr:hypothetical protein [Polyangiaceae bacterium]